MSQDRRFEKYMAQQFVKRYDPSWKYLRMGNDVGEPDVLFTRNGQVLGVEITTAFYEDTFRETKKFSDKQYVSPEDLMCDIIHKRVITKVAKKYHGVDTAILCVRVNDPQADDISVQLCSTHVALPAQHSFDGIYLLHKIYNNGRKDYELFKVFPR